eukprot:gene30483-19733_t
MQMMPGGQIIPTVQSLPATNADDGAKPPGGGSTSPREGTGVDSLVALAEGEERERSVPHPPVGGGAQPKRQQSPKKEKRAAFTSSPEAGDAVARLPFQRQRSGSARVLRRGSKQEAQAVLEASQALGLPPRRTDAPSSTSTLQAKAPAAEPATAEPATRGLLRETGCSLSELMSSNNLRTRSKASGTCTASRRRSQSPQAAAARAAAVAQLSSRVDAASDAAQGGALLRSVDAIHDGVAELHAIVRRR